MCLEFCHSVVFFGESPIHFDDDGSDEERDCVSANLLLNRSYEYEVGNTVRVVLLLTALTRHSSIPSPYQSLTTMEFLTPQSETLIPKDFGSCYKFINRKDVYKVQTLTCFSIIIEVVQVAHPLG